MMKKGIISVVVIFFTMGVFAQTSNEIDLIQAAFGIEKIAIVNNFVKPSPEQKEAFLKVYNEYELKRKKLGETRIKLLNQYANQWENMTNEQADTWMKDVMALSIKQDKLIKTYYNKVKSATNAKVATQFYQIEVYILTTIRYSILESIPFVGEKKDRIK